MKKCWVPVLHVSTHTFAYNPISLFFDTQNFKTGFIG